MGSNPLVLTVTVILVALVIAGIFQVTVMNKIKLADRFEEKLENMGIQVIHQRMPQRKIMAKFSETEFINFVTFHKIKKVYRSGYTFYILWNNVYYIYIP